MLQDIRQKYYYPGIPKHVKRKVEGCETFVKDKRVPSSVVPPEVIILPERDLGPKDVMQIDLLAIFSTSGGFQTLMTAIDVSSRYLFPHPLIEATAANVAKVLFDIMTKHITDKWFAFISTIVAKSAQI